MTVFNINLIRGRVIPRRNRVLGYCAMVAYQLLFGILLTGTACWGTLRVIKAMDQRHEMARLELHFEEAHPGQTDLVAYAKNLETEMFASATNLEAIERMLDQQSQISRILMGLALPLPQDIHIIKFDLDGINKQLNFDVAVPVDRREGSLTAGELIGMWETSPDQKNNLSAIKSDVSERQVVNGRAFFIFRFSGSFMRIPS